MKTIHFRLLLSFLMLAVSVIVCAEDNSLSIDFEEDVNTYGDWTFVNMTSKINTITAHGGSCHGTTGGKSTASITTKNKIVKPTSIDFYISKATDNTTESKWTVCYSYDGIEWKTLQTISATSMKKGEWSKVHCDLSSVLNVYIRVEYGNSTATRCIDDLNLNYSTDYSLFTVTWNVCGNETQIKQLEGTPIEFEIPEGIPDGFDFEGWSTQVIDGTSQTEPTEMVSSAIALQDIAYYAVLSKNGNKDVWKKVENQNYLTDGVYAIISYDKQYYLPNIKASGANPSAYAVSSNNGAIDIKEDMKWNVSINNGKIIFNNGEYYLWGKNSSTDIRINNTYSGGTKNWNLVKSDNYGLILKSEDNRYLATYGTQDWKHYTSPSDANKAAHLYKLSKESIYYCTTIPSVSVSLSSVGYGTLYYSDLSLKVPSGVVALTYSLNETKNFLVPITLYQQDDVIPAGEAVVIKGSEGTYSFIPSFTTKSPDEGNLLYGTDSEAQLVDDDSFYFYGLSLNNNGDANSVGFYWRADGGAAFTNGAHKAYLKIPKAESSQSKSAKLIFFDENETVINTVESVNTTVESIYSLSGTRQSGYAKGINIVKMNDGSIKKVLIK